MLTVAEFARRKKIGVPRVHQLLGQGVLPHKRLGSQVFIYDEALRWRPRKSRPLGGRMRDALIAELCGLERRALSANEQNRLARHLARLEEPDGAQLLADFFANRAVLKRYRCHPEDVNDLRADERIMLSGVSHPDSRLSAEDVVEGYVRPEHLAGVRGGYMLAEDPIGPIRLRVAEFPAEVLPVYLVADLADWEGPREAREAERVLNELFRGKVAV